MAHITILRTYAESVDPDRLPPTVKLFHTDFSLTIYDKYPKAHFHFLLLPFIRAPLRPADLRDLSALLRLPREQAKALLQRMQRDAAEATQLIQEEMVQRFGFRWGVQIGFHAVPSLEHIHLHILSDEFRGEYMKGKKHLNSFHPKRGFFLHLDEVLSWFGPDIEPTWFAMKSTIDKKEYEKLLKEDITCPHCDEPYKSMSKLTDHLRIIFSKRVQEHKKKADQAEAAAAASARNKRKLEDTEAGAECDTADSHPAKRQDIEPPAAEAS
ncbi:hypothetical protein C8Q80DRAFT_1170487 [Daedaleopsis nitida]|nr:hypothetical protein C8Q80DRAFT_1170487 [Daedaleopsis nitida]